MGWVMTKPVQTSPQPHCPECGARMVLRTNKASGDRFWGCSLYPECAGTRDIGPDGKPVFDEYDYTESDWDNDPRHYQTNGVY